MLVILYRHTGMIHPIAAAMIGFYLIDKTTAIHSTSGLETQLFVAVLGLNLFFALEFIDFPRWSLAVFLAVTAFVACLTRPEAVIYVLGIYLALAVSGVSKTDSRKKFLAIVGKLGISAILIASMGLMYVIWKLTYFGYLLPNPFYVKSGKFAFAGLDEVTAYLEHLSGWFLPLLVCVIVGLFVVAKKSESTSSRLRAIYSEVMERSALRRTWIKLSVIALPALMGLGFYTTIIHEVGGGFRFSYPTYFYIVLALGFIVTLMISVTRRHRGVEIALVCVAVFWLGIVFVSHRAWKFEPASLSAFGRFHTRIGEALRETELGSNGTVICDAAGVIPYLSGFNQVDRIGLTDNFMSGRSNPTNEEREDYLWSRPADVYFGNEPPASMGAEDASQDPIMNSRYVSEELIKRRLTLVESRIFVQDPKLLHARMRHLRDDWELVGEMDWPGWKAWKLKSFVYVRRGSPYLRILLPKFQRLIRYTPDQIDLNDLDRE